ncbi:MAG: Gfo/Idh/MocA family oxidoreductase [Acidobacteria bacterium]|jgi:predicted dehydrogenase|nr:Gfo/Idh/MocA family oxidoreductase [Acidobacteriota bacterium]
MSDVTRRDFVKNAAAATAVTAASYNRVLGANDRLGIGIIGPGQRGRSALMRNFFAWAPDKNATMVAICDIWLKNRERGAEMANKALGVQPKLHKNIDEILADKTVDGIFIANADFQHAKTAEAVVRAGKDCYCEKPMATVLQHAKDLIKVVKGSKQVVQVGTQRRSDGKYQQARQMMREGIIGEVKHVDIRWNVMSTRWRRADVNEVEEKDTDWKRFLMYRPARPFDKHLYMEWRLYRDFSSGIPDQWLSHQLDVVHWFTGDVHPLSCMASGGVYYWKDGRENEDTITVVYEYRKGFQVTYQARLTNGSDDPSELFYSPQGKLDTIKMTVTGDGAEAKFRSRAPVNIPGLPEARPKSAPTGPSSEPNAPTVGDATAAHVGNFLDCMRSRKQPSATVEDGLQSSVVALMALESLKAGRKVYFDTQKQEIVDYKVS